MKEVNFMNKPNYIDWVIEENGVIFNDGVPLNSYKITYDVSDEETLNQWALHIRKHYIRDKELEESLEDLPFSKEEYLKINKIPQKGGQGSVARSTDITEILVADILQFLMNYEVPRIKQLNRSNKDLSEHGTDVIGFRFNDSVDKPSRKDILVAAEVKARLSSTSFDTIKDAVKYSKKDKFRVATTLDYYRLKLKQYGDIEDAKKVTRFQLKSQQPYKTIYNAFAITDLDDIDGNTVIQINGADLNLELDQNLYFIHGNDLMNLAHNVYDRCKE